MYCKKNQLASTLAASFEGETSAISKKQLQGILNKSLIWDNFNERKIKKISPRTLLKIEGIKPILSLSFKLHFHQLRGNFSLLILEHNNNYKLYFFIKFCFV